MQPGLLNTLRNAEAALDAARATGCAGRDRECDHDSCHEPVTDADIDHILEYSNDGKTVQANGRVYCKWHHRWRHKHDRPPKPAA